MNDTPTPYHSAILGATSSLALVLARALAKRGDSLTLLARDEDALQRLQADLTARYSVPVRIALWEANANPAALLSFLDTLPAINSLYVVAAASVENASADWAQIDMLMRVNVSNPIAITRHIAEQMKIRKSGHITIISSVAGDRGRQSNYLYGSSKAALTAFASGLRNALYPYGVGVLTVKPGFIDTPLTYAMNSPLTASRERVVHDILRAEKNGTHILYTPWCWRVIMGIICHIPEVIFKRLKL